MLVATPLRNIAAQFGIPHFSSLQRHKPHVSTKLEKAAQRRDLNAADKLLSDVEWLWQESQQYVKDAHGAIKMQQVTQPVMEPILDDDGLPTGEMRDTGKTQTVYREFRDIGAMGPALAQAHANRRLFGDATGTIGQPAINIKAEYLSVVMPRSEDMSPAALPPGDVVDVQAIEPSSSAPILDTTTDE